MSTYKGRVVLVTGASSGIGACIAEDLVKEGLIVVGAARRVERIQALSERLKGQPGRLIAKKLDQSKPEEIKEVFKSIEKELGGVDVLINNAAILTFKPIHEQTVEEIKFTTDVNQIGVIVACQEAVKGFLRRGIDDGYIINISSVLGHRVAFIPGISLGIYPSTKFAITATSEALRHDMKNAGKKMRVTNISPGAVKTEMTSNIGPSAEVLEGNYLSPEEVSKTVVFALSMPKTAEITELTLRPEGEVL